MPQSEDKGGQYSQRNAKETRSVERLEVEVGDRRVTTSTQFQRHSRNLNRWQSKRERKRKKRNRGQGVEAPVKTGRRSRVGKARNFNEARRLKRKLLLSNSIAIPNETVFHVSRHGPERNERKEKKKTGKRRRNELLSAPRIPFFHDCIFAGIEFSFHQESSD